MSPIETAADIDTDRLIDFLHDLGIALDDGDVYVQTLNESRECDGPEAKIEYTVELSYVAKRGADVGDALVVEGRELGDDQ